MLIKILVSEYALSKAPIYRSLQTRAVNFQIQRLFATALPGICRRLEPSTRFTAQALLSHQPSNARTTSRFSGIPLQSSCTRLRNRIDIKVTALIPAFL